MHGNGKSLCRCPLESESLAVRIDYSRQIEKNELFFEILRKIARALNTWQRLGFRTCAGRAASKVSVCKQKPQLRGSIPFICQYTVCFRSGKPNGYLDYLNRYEETLTKENAQSKLHYQMSLFAHLVDFRFHRI